MDKLAFLIHFTRSRQRACRPPVCIALLLCLLASRAYADAALLLAEPYDRPGGFNPVAHAGHAGVYLTRVCAATSTVLRRCRAGEAGVVISRYDRVGELDWVAIPLMPYLYAVERAADVPTFATPDVVLTLRDTTGARISATSFRIRRPANRSACAGRSWSARLTTVRSSRSPSRRRLSRTTR